MNRTDPRFCQMSASVTMRAKAVVVRFEGRVDFVVDPPPVRNAWEHLVLVMPAADGVPLQLVVQALMLLVVELMRV